jgi:hypothetical protein
MKKPDWFEEDSIKLPNKLVIYNQFSYYALQYNNEGLFKFVITDNDLFTLFPRKLGSPFTYYSFTNFSPIYEISNIKAVEVLVDSIPVSMFKRAALGTLFLGGLGTVAGVISSIKAKPKSKLSVTIYLDSIELSAITVPCKKMADVSRLVSVLSNLETINSSNNSKDRSITNEMDIDNNQYKSNSISDEIMKLKNMLDEGLIELDEYKSIKKKIISGD